MKQLRDPAIVVAPEGIRALRDMASGLLAQILEGQRLRIDTAALDPLLQYLAQPERMGAVTGHAIRSARANFILETPAAWSPYQSALLPEETLVGPIRKRMARLMDRLRPPVQPTEAAFFLSALGASAWSSLAFQRDVATLIRRHLRSNVLMDAPMPRAIVLEDAFWWLLLGTANSTPAFSRAAIDIAKDLTARPGWAGFWEQVLLRGYYRTTTPPHEAVKGLPLLASGVASLDAKGTDDPETARPGWRKEAPDWARHYLEGRI